MSIRDDIAGALCEARNRYGNEVAEHEGDWVDFDTWMARAAAAVVARRLREAMGAAGLSSNHWMRELLAELEEP